MTMVRCGSCDFFTPSEPAARPTQRLDQPVPGTCYRYPPRPFPVGGQNPITGQAQMGAVGVRPPVNSSEGCGEGSARLVS